MTGMLHTELWTSWAAVLRSYASLHGLNSPQHAVVEVSAEEITLRVGSRWVRFMPEQIADSQGDTMSFRLNENGTVSREGHADEEMDLAAEETAGEIMPGFPSISLHRAWVGNDVWTTPTSSTLEIMSRDEVLAKLREHAPELRAKGVLHLALFGSVARNEADAESDIDIAAEYDPEKRLSLLGIARIQSDLEDLFGVKVDLCTRRLIKPILRPYIEADIVDAF